MKKITNFAEKTFTHETEKVFIAGYTEKVHTNEEIIEVYIDPNAYTIDEVLELGFMSSFFAWMKENHGIDEDAFEKLPFYKKAEMIYKYEEFDEIARIEVFANEEDAKEYLDYCKFVREGV